MHQKRFPFLLSMFYFLISGVTAQDTKAISDFYEFANKDWLDETALPYNVSVINNWGILWDEITIQSIEILSGELEYDIDGDHQYMLQQLQNFYMSAAEKQKSEKERVFLVQAYYPVIYGVVFAKITIPRDKEKKIRELINYVSIAYQEKIENSTKIKESSPSFFLARLNDLQFNIGAPDISDLPKMPQLSPIDFEKNIKLTEAYQEKVGPIKPVWDSPPFETDCRYNPNSNSISLYAGILFGSDFTDENDYATWFASLGRTMAHEMTHAFDAYGKKWNKNDWKSMRASLVKQFNSYEVQEGHFVDGEKTLQENFADLGGVEVSILAMKKYMMDYYPGSGEEEYSEALRNYFIAYAQFWKEKATQEFELAALQRIHTPQKFRAIGPVYNQNEFYEVFDIDVQSEYYIPKNQRITIW